MVAGACPKYSARISTSAPSARNWETPVLRSGGLAISQCSDRDPNHRPATNLSNTPSAKTPPLPQTRPTPNTLCPIRVNPCNPRRKIPPFNHPLPLRVLGFLPDICVNRNNPRRPLTSEIRLLASDLRSASPAPPREPKKPHLPAATLCVLCSLPVLCVKKTTGPHNTAQPKSKNNPPPQPNPQSTIPNLQFVPPHPSAFILHPSPKLFPLSQKISPRKGPD